MNLIKTITNLFKREKWEVVWTKQTQAKDGYGDIKQVVLVMEVSNKQSYRFYVTTGVMDTKQIVDNGFVIGQHPEVMTYINDIKRVNKIAQL